MENLSLPPFASFQDLHEDWGYDMTLFIADFGGSLGFLLGVSILSVLEIVEGIFMSTYKMLRSRDGRAGSERPSFSQSKSAKLSGVHFFLVFFSQPCFWAFANQVYELYR